MSDESGPLTFLGQGRTVYPQKPEDAKLETFDNKYRNRPYVISFDCPEFTSVCPITGQPDFAKIKITYIPDRSCIESKSLKLYLFSFRNSGMFHEEITNKILEDVISAANPIWAKVVGLMNPRGGISIEVTAEYINPSIDPNSLPKIP
jgi:7-cyano-7-deazaguanine reductase